MSSLWLRLKISLLHLAAEASRVKSQAGFNLADTYIIVSGLNPKVSRFCAFIMWGKQISNPNQRAVQANYEDRFSWQRSRSEACVSPGCWFKSLGVRSATASMSGQFSGFIGVVFFLFSYIFFKEFEGIKLIKWEYINNIKSYISSIYCYCWMF